MLQNYENIIASGYKYDVIFEEQVRSGSITAKWTI